MSVQSEDSREFVSNVKYQVDSKMCSRCRGIYESSFFYRSSRSPDGLQSYCKSCDSEVKATRYYSNTRATIEKSQAWYSANRDSVMARKRDRYRVNPTKHKLAKQRNVERNKDRVASGETIVPEYQVCKTCGENKPINNYYTNWNYKTGYARECIVCHNVRSRRNRELKRNSTSNKVQ